MIEVTESLLKNNPSLAHRDIKPENIMISDNNDVILMDMEVLKIIGAPSMSDVDQKQFLGTLRYAPPEFLTRNENDTMEGWRAVNIYQIGAVLHDLLMKKELFAGIEPYASLVIAIKEDMPKITSAVLHPDLVQLARNMLHKDWKRRLVLSSIEIIKSTLQRCLLPQNDPANFYTEIKKNALPIQVELEKIESISRSKAEKEKIMLKIHFEIWNIIDESFNNQETNEIINKIESSKPFVMDTLPVTMPQTKYRFYHITGKFEYGFAKPFFILFKVENDENSYCKLSILGIIPTILQDRSIENPEVLMYNFFSREKKYPPPNIRITNPPELIIPTKYFFDGIIEFADNSFKGVMDKTIALMLKIIVQKMKPDIQEELERRKKRINSGPGVYVTISRSQGPVFIDIQEGRTLSF